MDLQHLRNFLVVVEQGSISDAATLLRITQPALSRQVQALEGQVGAALLDRTRRGVVPTPAGAALAFEARRILASVREAQDAVDMASGRRGGRLAIGASPSLARQVMPGLALLARDSLPGVQLSFIEGQVDELREMLLDGRVDMALADYRTPLARLTARPLFAEPIVAVGPPGTFAPGGQIGMKAFLLHDCVLAASSGRLRLLYEKLAARAGVREKHFVEVDSLSGLIEMVAAGVGVALLPYSLIEPEVARGRMSFAQFSPMPLKRSVARLRSEAKTATPVSEAMDAIIDRLVAQHAARLLWEPAKRGAMGKEHSA